MRLRLLVAHEPLIPHTALVTLEVLRQLHATPCDFAWLTLNGSACTCGRALVRLSLSLPACSEFIRDARSVRAIAPGAYEAPIIRVSKETLDALGVSTRSSFLIVSVHRMIHAALLQPWNMLELRPRGLVAASSAVLTTTELRLDLCCGATHQRTSHAWHGSSCRCAFGLLPRHGKLLRFFGCILGGSEATFALTCHRDKDSLILISTIARSDAGGDDHACGSEDSSTAAGGEAGHNHARSACAVPRNSAREWGLVCDQTRVRQSSNAFLVGCPNHSRTSSGTRDVDDACIALLRAALLCLSLRPRDHDLHEPTDRVPQQSRSGSDPPYSASSQLPPLPYHFLLCGPRGVGKTANAGQLCAELGLPLLRWNPWEHVRRGGSCSLGATLLQLLLRARRCRPSIALLESVDDRRAITVCSDAPGSLPREHSQMNADGLRVVRSSRTMDAVLMRTVVSPRLVHSHVLDECYCFGLAMHAQSTSYCAAIFRSGASLRGMDLSAAGTMPTLVRLLVGGFILADLVELGDQARAMALVRAQQERLMQPQLARLQCEEPGAVLSASATEWYSTARFVRPSELLGLLVVQCCERPLCGRTELHRHAWVRRRLEQLVLWPLLLPSWWFRMHDSCGILLCGLPGTGKTLFARALAFDCGINLLPVTIAQLTVPEVGGSERAIAALFARARAHAPCMLLIDELQAIFGQHDDGDNGGIGGCGEERRGGMGSSDCQMLSQLLFEMDGLREITAAQTSATAACHTQPSAIPSASNAAIVVCSTSALSVPVVLIGITNHPWALDPSLTRPGRLEHALVLQG